MGLEQNGTRSPLVMAHAEPDETITFAVAVEEPRQELRGRGGVIVRDVHAERVGGRTRRRTGTLALLALVAAGAGVAGLLGASSRTAVRRRRIATGTYLGSAVLGAALVRWQLARLFTEEPHYVVELREGDFEIRRYDAFHVARTEASGEWRSALDEGFRKLAGYIFGGNIARDPRTLAAGRDHHPQKISMTVPVLSEREDDHHIVSFVMPPSAPPEGLPIPNDRSVHLHPVEPRRIAVLRFRGTYDTDTVRAKQEELFELCERAGLEPCGEPAFAGYDPPTTLPLLRRDEVWLPIKG